MATLVLIFSTFLAAMPVISTATNVQTPHFRSSPNLYHRNDPNSRQSDGFPASYQLFSSSFKEPEPPLVTSEFSCNFKQHKWNPNVSHIASGTIYVSPSNRKVRADAAYASSLSSSLFDYANLSATGLVSNKVYTLTPNVAAQPAIFSEYVVPAFPLWEADTLVKSNAVYGGIVEDRDMGTVTSWNLVFQVPVKVYLNIDNIVMGYDFYDVSTRTGVITRYFNVEIGKLDAVLFDFPE